MLLSDVHELQQVAVVFDFRCTVHNKIIRDPTNPSTFLKNSVHLQLEYVLAHGESEWKSQKTVSPERCLERGQLLTFFIYLDRPVTSLGVELGEELGVREFVVEIIQRWCLVSRTNQCFVQLCSADPGQGTPGCCRLAW